MQQYAGIWFPDDGTLTKHLRARLDAEPLYHGDRFGEAMRYVKDFRFAVDCGANVGMWTTALAKRFRQVIAIEADPANVECLRANVAKLSNVDPVWTALGETVGRVALVRDKTALSSRVIRGDEVTIGPLDDFKIGHCGYLKLHVNGYELPVLKGAVETLRRCKPVLTVVLKPKLAAYDTAPEDIIAWLEAHGYALAGGQKPYRIFTPKP